MKRIFSVFVFLLAIVALAIIPNLAIAGEAFPTDKEIIELHFGDTVFYVPKTFEGYPMIVNYGDAETDKDSFSWNWIVGSDWKPNRTDVDAFYAKFSTDGLGHYNPRKVTLAIQLPFLQNITSNPEHKYGFTIRLERSRVDAESKVEYLARLEKNRKWFYEVVKTKPPQQEDMLEVSQEDFWTWQSKYIMPIIGSGDIVSTRNEDFTPLGAPLVFTHYCGKRSGSIGCEINYAWSSDVSLIHQFWFKSVVKDTDFTIDDTMIYPRSTWRKLDQEARIVMKSFERKQ